jgi:hypothetical protein
MATTKTLLSNLSSLVHNGVMTQKEADKFKNRILKEVQQAEHDQKVQALSLKTSEFMTPGVQYSISDLVKEVMGILAPCHGHKETKAEQKYRDGVAKPLMKAALENLGVVTVGSGAQTRYMVQPQLPALAPITVEPEAHDED